MPLALAGLAAASLKTKIGLGIGVILALVIGYFLLTATLENRNLEKERDKLSLAITDPKTGYIARLTQANANVVILQEAIKVQNDRMVAQSNAAKAELERLKKELAVAQAQSRAAQRRVDAFMAAKPQGSTLEERVTDIDNRILEDLKR